MVLTIKWLIACTEVTVTFSTKMRPVDETATYIFASSFRREVSGVSQVEQEGATVCLAPALLIPALPVLTGVTTNTITILDLKYTHRFALVVTA